MLLLFTSLIIQLTLGKTCITARPQIEIMLFE